MPSDLNSIGIGLISRSQGAKQALLPAQKQNLDLVARYSNFSFMSCTHIAELGCSLGE